MKRLALLLAALLVVLVAPPVAVANGKADHYVQPVWFHWSEERGLPIDVLIVPPAHGQVYNGDGVLGGDEGGTSELSPYENSYLQAIEASIAAYPPAIAEFGPGWLKNGIVLNVYVLGRDDVPPEARSDPEILVVTDENKGPMIGVTVSSDPCIVDNSKMLVTSFTYADMYNVNGHEFGHCLGLHHVEGGENDDRISTDLMNATYASWPGDSGNPRLCISNLNVRGLAAAFAPVLGKSVPERNRATVARNDYKRAFC